VERVTDFEKGFPWAEAKINGKWVVDPIHDDQAAVVKVKNKGLVVVSGCSHSGIINIVRYAQKVTQTEKVHAVLGGFHLSGPLFEPIVEPTIEEMKKIKPDLVVPMHCTGWKAINQFALKMPEQFQVNIVGSTYVF
jgi:7,8-dihydropterin-6-yl-methyl-4-(beta-D-ribofuranosyl)aminobenzene 5'-phosphate synthase